jgi:glycosyltransferase involved in cell wall biosynthesis
LSDWPRAPLLLVASSSRTGPAEGLILLASHLRARGIDARFAGDTVRPGDLGEHLERARVPWVRELRCSRKVRTADLVHDARTLASWVREGTPDLLHASFPHDHHLCLWAASRAPRAVRDELRVVRTAHRRIDVTAGALGQRRWALRRSDGVVVHSEAYRAELLRLGLAPERVAAIPGGVDAERFSPGRAPQLREQWRVPQDAPLAGIVARMKPERGHRVLLAAFAEALQQAPDAWLVLVGRGEDEEPLKRFVAGLPGRAAERIVFGGYARGEELVAAYRALDVGVWLREGNDGACRGVLEAMACGVPMIVGGEGAPGELVRDGVDGVVLEASGVNLSGMKDFAPSEKSPSGLNFFGRKLSAALAALLSDPARARACGAAARLRAASFTPDRFSSSVLSFWRTLRALPPVR